MASACGWWTNFVIANDPDERTYLAVYFGRPHDEYELARFFLMRQVLHMFYAAVFRMLGSAAKAANQEESLPSFWNFHRRIWAGEVNLRDQAARIVYGRVHWERLLQNVREPRFEQALSIVSERHRGQTDLRRLLPAAP
jgi:hypothetical protein